MRRHLPQSFQENQEQAIAALARRWGSMRHVQDMVELLAKLQGEFVTDPPEARSRGVSVIVIRGERAIDPAEFRRRADARMVLEAAERERAVDK